MCIKKNDINTKETIEQLFNFYDEDLYRNTEENKEFVARISKLEEPFYESLNDNQKKEFEELIELHALNGAVTDKRIFIYAFSLAIKLILEYGFKYLNLHSIRLDLLSANKRAHKCYLKCGFKDTGASREEIFLDGKYYDKLHMDILENEFDGGCIKNKNI